MKELAKYIAAKYNDIAIPRAKPSKSDPSTGKGTVHLLVEKIDKERPAITDKLTQTEVDKTKVYIKPLSYVAEMLDNAEVGFFHNDKVKKIQRAVRSRYEKAREKDVLTKEENPDAFPRQVVVLFESILNGTIDHEMLVREGEFLSE